jgi:tetratricopeptide (TPR) repeat protein
VEAPERALREVRDRITGAVAALANSGLATWFQHVSAPPTIAAYREYAHALLEREPMDRAAYMRRASALDTTFTWGALLAAQILLAYGPVQADSLMRALEARRDQLPAVQVHALNGLRARQADNRLVAYDELSRAASLAPHIFLPDFAQAARTLYRPRESLQLLDRFDALRAAEKRRPTGLVRTELLHQLGDHWPELRVVLQARRDYPRGLQSLYLEVRTRAALGQLRRVRVLLDSALSYPRERNYTPGNLMMIAAVEFRAHGRPAAQKELLRRAIDWYRDNPTAQSDSSISYIATALYQAGRWDEAEPLFRKMLVKDSAGAVFYLGALGAIAAQRGDRMMAAQRYADSLDAVRFPNELRAYEGKYERARIKALLGDAQGALQLLREAAGPQGMDLHAEFDFESLLDIPAFKEFTRPKG